MFIEIKQQMRFAVFFIINALWPLIMSALPCAGLVPVIHRRELISAELSVDSNGANKKHNLILMFFVKFPVETGLPGCCLHFVRLFHAGWASRTRQDVFLPLKFRISLKSDHTPIAY